MEFKNATKKLESRLPKINRPKLIACVLLMLLVQGCTNSKLVISPLYNRLDDRMRDQFNELATFNEQQTAAFEQMLGTFHVWHRQQELPGYAQLMKTVASSISNEDTTEDDIQRWFATAEQHTVAVRQCHPINFSFDLIRSFSDEQLASIEEHVKKERLEDVERYESRTPDERVERRIRNAVKFAGRLNVEFTPTQRAMLLSAFKQQRSLRKEYFALSSEWQEQFFQLASDRENPNFEADIRTHLGKLRHLLEDAHPEQWRANRDLWKETSLRLISSLSKEQRRQASSWVSKMSRTLESISRDKPSFEVGNDESIGCLVQS